MEKVVKVKRALISVSDKTGLEFTRDLNRLGIEIISTGGTASKVREFGVPVTEVSELPGSFPEMLKGRVKTLQPSVLGGVLVKQDDSDQMAEIKNHEIKAFQLVIINFYPWEKKIKETGISIEEIIEEGMDIGGPTGVCSAIKSYPYVAVVVDPNDYGLIIKELELTGGISEQLRIRLAVKAAFEVAWYRYMIYQWMATELGVAVSPFPDRLLLGLEKVTNSRYGENPHQKGAFYRLVGFRQPSIATARFCQGQIPSATAMLDFNAAVELAREVKGRPFVVLIKHGTPCGVGKAETFEEAFKIAWAMDSSAAFGCFIGINGVVSTILARMIVDHKVDGVVACGFEEGALKILAERKKMPVFELGSLPPLEPNTLIMKPVIGGMELQQADIKPLTPEDLEVKCGLDLTVDQKKWICDEWDILKHVKSNAIIVLNKDGKIVGIGGGDVSRVEAGAMALSKAGEEAKGGILLSDALIPFDDLIKLAANYGILIVVETGGSTRDNEVIAAAKKYSITIVFTGRRAFYH